jgi:hypothetical protein
MNYLKKTAQDNQSGSPFDFFVDQFSTKYEERTSQDNQRGRPHEIVVDQFEASVKKGLHKKIKWKAS